MHEFILVYVTAGSEAEAQAIAHELVSTQLAACVSLSPVTSIYRWQGDVQTETEWQLTIKTRSEQFEAVKTAIETLHSYDVPECIAVPIVAGSTAYLQWLRNSTEYASD